MSGIGGWIGQIENGERLLRSMTNALAHRGPDGVAAWGKPWAGLIYTHFAVSGDTDDAVSLCEAKDGMTLVVFDGVLTNVPELVRLCMQAGIHAEDSSVQNLIAALYQVCGVDFLGRLRGNYAVAVLDRRERRLILARDRFAAKPLFYASGRGCLAFGSEIPALFGVPGVDLTPDRQAIADMAALFFIPPPQTFYAGIRSLEAGEVLIAHLDGDKVRVQQTLYHRWHFAPDHKTTPGQAVDRAEALLRQAVARQTPRDAPTGASLSGGIDSSLVCYFAQEFLGRSIPTFTMVSSNPIYDDSEAAAIVAEFLDSDQRILDVDDIDGSYDAVASLLGHIGQPITDIVAIPNFALAQLMRERVRVALSGNGAETAYGYGAIFHWMRPVRWIQAFPSSIQREIWRMVAGGARFMSKRGFMRHDRAGRLESIRGVRDIPALTEFLLQATTPDQRVRILQPFDAEPVRRLFEHRWTIKPGATWVDRLMANSLEANGRYLEPGRIYYIEDIVSARAGIQARLPALDEDMTAYGFTLPARLLSSWTHNKICLRMLAARHLPAAIAHKPKKGFAFDAGAWASEDFRQGLRENLLTPGNPLDDYFRPDAYRAMIKAFCDQAPFPGLAGNGLARHVMMFLSTYLALTRSSP